VGGNFVPKILAKPKSREARQSNGGVTPTTSLVHRPLGAFFDVNQLARRWNLSTRTVRRLIADREFAVTRIGRRVLVSEREVALFEAKNTHGI
jgi:excisionase family DNA binding protein